MSKKSILGLVVAFGLLMGCGDDAKKVRSGALGQTRCNATYIVSDVGDICQYGECGIYDEDLRVHNCPTDIPLCIKDNNDKYYCGNKCPDGMHEVSNVAEFASMCEIEITGCSVVDCLTADGHEGWAKAECSDDGLCKAVECRNGYFLHDNNCLSAVQCCGDACIDCSDNAGWKFGECKEGKCIAELCNDGYVFSKQNDDSVICVSSAEKSCNEKVPCPSGQECDYKSGMCVCAAGRTFCGDGCYSLNSNDEHCGNCNSVCGDIEHGTSYCYDGKCKAICFEGYMSSDDEGSCVTDDGSCKIKGDVRCGHDENGNMTIMTCQDNMWKTTKTCIMGKGSEGGYCGSDCVVFCADGYMQNKDKSGCESKTSSCTNGEKRCNDNGVKIEYLICKNKKWEVEKNCKYENSWMLTCSPETGCEFDCTKGYKLNSEGTQCVFDAEATCTNGETRCGGTEFHRCENNHWTIVEECHLQGKHGGAVHCDNKMGCQYYCSENHVLCGVNTCADLKNDSDNCGSCGTSCGYGSCVNGLCK